MRVLRLVLLVVLGAALLSGCLGGADRPPLAQSPERTVAADPLQSGPHAVVPFEYDFGYYVVDDPSLLLYQYPVPLHGSLHLPDGDGPFPLILLMHGRHGTCQYGGQLEFLAALCADAPPVIEPVNSYTGYEGLAMNLASWGYAVASIDANAINDRDLLGDAGANARGLLLLRTLDEFASVNATGTGLGTLGGGSLPTSVPANAPQSDLAAAKGKLDLSRVGLMGHSRGGEGVARAVGLDLERHGGAHGLDAVFALAPTDFGRWPVPGVAFATLLPYCDGDVSNLQGAWMYDDARRLEPAAPRHQVLAMGANHNFYNTVWTGDDWGTAGAWCGSEDDGTGRDTPEQQRAHGHGLMASFFRLYVGGEMAFAPMWNGAVSKFPGSLCPDRPSCDDRLYASAIPTRHRDLTPTNRPGLPEKDFEIQARDCEPSGCPFQPVLAGGTLASWFCELNGTAHFGVNDLADWSAFSMRVGGQPENFPRLWLEAKPTQARSADVEFPLRPGDEDTGKTVLNEIRIPLSSLGDLRGVDELVLHCDGTPRPQHDVGLLVTDLMLQ